MNINIGKGGSGKITSTKGGSGKLIEKKYIDLLPSQENISLLFDPIFYNSFENRNHGSMDVPEVLKNSIRKLLKIRHFYQIYGLGSPSLFSIY